MNSRQALLTALMTILAPFPCFAHDTWLLPRSAHVQDGKPITVDLTTGTKFPDLESAIAADRVASGGWRTTSASGRLDKHEEGTSSLVMHLTPHGKGTAVLFLSLKPMSIKLDANQVADYFEEIGAPEALRRDWEAAGSDAEFRETYTKYAKTFVRVGDGGEDPACRRQVGLNIEFIPQRDPTALAVGDSLVVKAVRGGNNELESFAVGIVCGKTGDSQLLRTNKAGFVAFPITDSGWWLVRGTEVRRKSDGTYESDFSTMTFFVEDE